MCFHSARLDSRVDDKGSIVLLQSQDRSKWNNNLIQQGVKFLGKASEPEAMSEYHLEASIMACHCLAENYEKTDWKKILNLYDHLLQNKKSEIIALNRAVVFGELYGPEAGIRELKTLRHLDQNYLYHAALGDFYGRHGKLLQAQTHLQKAIRLTESAPEKNLLQQKINNLVN